MCPPSPGSKAEALAILELLYAGEPASSVAAQHGMTPNEMRKLLEHYELEI